MGRAFEAIALFVLAGILLGIGIWFKGAVGDVYGLEGIFLAMVLLFVLAGLWEIYKFYQEKSAKHL